MTTDTRPDSHHHFRVIERALAEIDVAQQAGAPLSLATLAARLGMSAGHFQRTFSAWVGVSPKCCLQYLAPDLARDLVARKLPLNHAADATGPSGTGRLHDLFLSWEAMSPGAYAKGGAGLDILWGWFESPFGPALIMGTKKGICGIGFAAGKGAEATMADLLSRWPQAHFTEDPMTLAPLAEAAFPRAGAARDPVRLYLIGTPFQIKVWAALMAIPSGQVTTYSDITRAIGHPRAVRAAGTAVGRNPISFLIPCHRVLRKSGGLGGYHWGLGVKRAMLGWEAARADVNAST